MIGHSNLSLSIMVAVIVLVSNSTAFTLRHSQESNCRILRRSQDWGLYHRVGRYCHKKELLCLSLASRDEKSRSSDEILISMKQVRSKKSYNVPGYVRGRLDLISSVFKTYSLDGEMAYSSFLDSKYLRFWPGRKADLEKIWADVTSDCPESSVNTTHLPTLLSKLDDVADRIELEMEQERLAWELEEIKHNFLDKYFESASRERELSFFDFIAWDSIQAQIWYKRRGLSERRIAEIWEKVAGCVTRGVDKDTFVRIYKTVCTGSY